MKRVLFETAKNICTITINNPEKLNCLDMEMLGFLEAGLMELKKKKSARAVVIKGAGDKAFSTGGNLNDFTKLSEFHEIREWISYGNEVFNLLEHMPTATIAAIAGYCMGGGLELALSCDLRIATENSIFSMPELNHGWVPGWGGLSRLQRLIGEAKAKEIIMLGEKINAQEALRIGLINKICNSKDLEQMTHNTALKLSKIDPFLMEMSKNSILDRSRTTTANDMLFDVLATNYSRK